MFYRRSRSSKRGYSLAEMVIVLGIIGSVVGGIWIASGKVNESNKAKRAAEQVAIIAGAYRKLLANDPTSGACWGPDINAFGITNNAFPEDMLGTGVPRNPWGGLVAVYGCNTPIWRGIIIEYQGLSQRVCNLVGNAIINPNVQNWVRIGVGAGNPLVPSTLVTNGSTAPIGTTSMPSVANFTLNACTNSPNGVVQIMFPIRS